MNIHDLRQAQALYIERLEDKIKERSQYHAIRNQFVKDFNINKISLLEKDDYVIGKGNHASFCYRIERDLDCLGRIKGARASKFGLYYGKTKSDPIKKYRNTAKWSGTPDEANEKIKKSIIELIIAGSNNDIVSIKKNKISPMFKGKILATYYPERFLNVFSEAHLDHFITFFDLDTPELLNADALLKRNVLIDFKNQDVVMRDWSIDLFSDFLYTEYPRRPIIEDDTKPKKKKKISNPILDDYRTPDFPPNPVASEIALNILPFVAPNPRTTNPNNNSKPDYEKINRQNKKLGDRGEKVVLDFEKERLKNTIYKDKVDRVSLKSDSLGYDILSFEQDGKERYIEVKATRSKVGNVNFFLTINELKTAQEKENYYIYLVYDILSKEPKIWIIGNPFNPDNENVNLEPINFKVSIKVDY